MQLSPRTLAILKNFSNINPGIVFKPGQVIKTITAPEMDLLAVASVVETFERQFGIADLSQFISVLSSFETPTLRFKDKTLTVSQDDRVVQYTYGEESFIKSPPDKDITMSKALVKFKILESNLGNLIKMVSVLGLPEIAMVGEKGTLYLRGTDVKNTTNNVYNQKIESDKVEDFMVVFNADKINRLMLMDYDVTISEGVVKFEGKDVTYWMAPLEKYSSYGK